MLDNLKRSSSSSSSSVPSFVCLYAARTRSDNHHTVYVATQTRRLCAFEAAYSQLCSTTTTTVTPSAFQTFCLTDDTAVHTSPRSSEKLLLKQKPATKVVDQNRNENAVLLLHDPFKKHLGTLQNVKKVVKAALGASSVQCLHHVVAVEAPR